MPTTSVFDIGPGVLLGPAFGLQRGEQVAIVELRQNVSDIDLVAQLGRRLRDSPAGAGKQFAGIPGLDLGTAVRRSDVSSLPAH